MSRFPPSTYGIAACVALLALTNIQLLRLDGPSARDRARQAGVDPGALPEPRGPNGQALLREFSVTTKRFDTMLADVRDEIASAADTVRPLGRGVAALSRLAAESGELPAAVRALRPLLSTLGPLGGVAPSLAELPDAVAELNRALARLDPVVRDVAALDEGVAALVGAADSVTQQTSDAGAAMRGVGARLAETNTLLEQLVACLRTPVLCDRIVGD